MTSLYKNASGEPRVWPGIQKPDGSTLELDPNETAELDLPDDFDDTFLIKMQAAAPAPVKIPPAPTEAE